MYMIKICRLSRVTIMSTTREGGRRIKVEVRGLPETRHMLMFIDEKMRKVGDLTTKLRFVCSDIKKTDEIKIYRDKFLLPDNEYINIIETGEEIIVYRKDTETEYVEKKEDKSELLNVREEILKEKENEFEIRKTNLKISEEDLKAKEDVLEKKEKEVQLKEKETKMKEEDLMKNSCSIKAREEELEKKERTLDMKIKNNEEKEKRAKNLLIQAKTRINELGKSNQIMRAMYQANEVMIKSLKQKVYVLSREKAQLEANLDALRLAASLNSPVSSILQNTSLEAPSSSQPSSSEPSYSSFSSSTDSDSEDEIVHIGNKRRRLNFGAKQIKLIT